MFDYRALVAFLINNKVLVFFIGISLIVFMLPDYINCEASILGVIYILLLVAIVYRDLVVNDIKIVNVSK